MTKTFVAFIRAVMVGRDGLHRDVLLDIFECAGASNPVSYITTGNVSFEAPAERVETVAQAASEAISDLVGRPTDVFVRNVASLLAMANSDPFADQPLIEDHAEEVTFFSGPVPDDLVLPIKSPSGDVVVFAAGKSELFAVAKRIGGQSRGAGGLIATATAERITSRSMSTILHILHKLE